jgi:hypothetical protein
MRVITEISPEQFDLIRSYRSKWQQWTFSLEPLDRAIATETLNTAYELSGYAKPTLFFFDNPHQAIEQLGLPTTRTPVSLVSIVSPIIQQIRAQFLPILWTRFWRRGGYVYATEMHRTIVYPLMAKVRDEFGWTLPDSIQRTIEVQASMVSDGALLDFCMTTLGCTHTEVEQWQTVTALIQHCFWHLAFEDICIVIERPQ